MKSNIKDNRKTKQKDIEPKQSKLNKIKWKKIKSKQIFAAILSIVLVLSGLWLIQALVMPKYMHGIVEGAMIAEYYKEDKNHDVIFIGDCELYENISPAVLWEEYGINSYIRGSAQQLIWQSYYLMEETFRYEKPKVVVFNVLSMQYHTPQSEAYNRMTLDGMRFSFSKIKAIQASMTEEEHLIEYIFPILRYHSRISELEKDDFTYLFHKDKVTHNGYYMRVDVKAAGTVPKGRPLGDYSFDKLAYEYLDKMTALCKENGVELVLVKAPSLYPYWYEEWDSQMVDYADRHNLKYYNFLDVTEEIGLDFQTDTYDGGLQLNLSGAEKLSRYFGEILQKECHLPSRQGEKKLEESWEKKLELYYEEKKTQEEQLSQDNNL